jgi:hypothetical protein
MTAHDSNWIRRDDVGTVTRFGHLGGGLLVALGALGLAVTGLADPLAPQGKDLLVLTVNPAQNLVHIAIGLLMIGGAAGSHASARTTMLVASAALGTLGLVGLVLNSPTGNPLAINGWGNLLHLGLAGWGTMVLIRDHDRASQTMEATTS